MEKLLLRLTFSSCLIIGAIALNSYSGGGFSSDRTGSPVSSSTCQTCHSSFGLNSGIGSVSMTVPSNYYPGSTYSVTMNVSQSTPTPVRYGHMAGVLRDNNANGGTFTAATGTSATTISGRSYIRHTSVTNTTGSWTYSWTAPSYEDTITFYYVGVAANGASGNSGDYVYTGSTTIYPIAQITADIDSTGTTCNGDCDGSISLSNVSGGQGGPYTYSWSNSSTTSSITGLCGGTYTVTIEDASGNEEVIEVIVDEPDMLTAQLNPMSTTCVAAMGEISTTITGGTQPYSYLWSNGSTDSTLMNVGPGMYTVTVTDANGCEVSEMSEVQSSGSGLAPFITKKDEFCGNADGFINVQMIIGNPPYTYVWNTGGTSGFIGGLSAGTYTVTVTDSNGCEEVFTESISEHFTVINDAGAIVSDVSCYGGSDASISIPPGQAIPPAIYDWSNGSTGASIFDLVAGEYSVTLTDSTGCSDTASFTITEPDSVEVVVSADSANEGFCDGFISVTPSGGTPPFSYAWSHDASVTTASANDLCSGDYTITVTDDNGCETEIMVSVGTVTGIGSVANEEVRVFPNPTSGMIYIDAKEKDIESISLMDISGKLVKEWNTGIEEGLDLGVFNAGRYTVKITASQGVVVRPIVIQR